MTKRTVPSISVPACGSATDTGTGLGGREGGGAAVEVLPLGSMGEVSAVCGAVATPTELKTSSVGRGGRASCCCCGCCWVWGPVPVARRFCVEVEMEGGLCAAY